MSRAAISAACALALAAAGLASEALAGGQPERGKTKAAVCAACHGTEGNKPTAPENPILAGQPQDYLVHALTEYKKGKRTNPIMKGFAAQLSKQDIEDLAAWFASQPSPLHVKR